MHWAPNWRDISVSISGRSTAAVFTETLSAPAMSSAAASSMRRTPPPTVSGMESSARTRRTVS